VTIHDAAAYGTILVQGYGQFGKHAVETPRQVHSPLLVPVDEHLRVRVIRSKEMSLPDKKFAQFLVIVDLPIVDDGNRMILIPHRLGATWHVNDGEPTVPQVYTSRGIDKCPIAVRTSMAEGVHHARQVASVAQTDEGRNATHQRCPSQLMRSRT